MMIKCSVTIRDLTEPKERTKRNQFGNKDYFYGI